MLVAEPETLALRTACSGAAEVLPRPVAVSVAWWAIGRAAAGRRAVEPLVSAACSEAPTLRLAWVRYFDHLSRTDTARRRSPGSATALARRCRQTRLGRPSDPTPSPNWPATPGSRRTTSLAIYPECCRRPFTNSRRTVGCPPWTKPRSGSERHLSATWASRSGAKSLPRTCGSTSAWPLCIAASTSPCSTCGVSPARR